MDTLFKDIFSALRFPKSDTIFDFYVDPHNPKNFIGFENKLEEFAYNKETPYFNMLVPTIDTTKYSYVLERLCDICKKLKYIHFNILI